MISINNLSLVFGERYLLDSVSFMINKRDRIGLTGKNGAGKSTLLKIIAGEIQPTDGGVSKSANLKIGYLPQTKVYSEGETVRNEAKKAFSDTIKIKEELDTMNIMLTEREDYESDSYMKLIDDIHMRNDLLSLSGYDTMEAEIESVLKGLGFKQEDFERKCEEFSGGWRMRIELAKILLASPDVFLLDEPTNHLDIDSITWLESFLQNYSGAVVLVSHDRAFLDNITERTIEISLGKVYDYKVPYTKYTELRKERIEQQLRAYENQQKQIKDTEDFIDRFRYKATKSVQVQSRIKQLNKLDIIEIDHEDNSKIKIRFQPAIRSGEIAVSGKELAKYYGDKKVFADANIEIERGDKVALVGRNGEGKTTMIKMINSEIEYSGDIKIGHNIKIGYFAQNQADLLDANLSVLDTVDMVAVGDIRKKIRDILGAFLFSGEDVDKKVKVLSGGERTRLAMVKLLLEPYNLLILDEPTNHLDLRTKDILKEALNNFEGTIIVVSHDRDFLSGLVDKVYEFADGNVKEYLGGISDFLYAKKMSCFKEYENIKVGKNIIKEDKQTDNISENKRSYEENKKYNRELRRLENIVSNLEKDISKTEQIIEKMVEDMANGSSDVNLYDDYADAKSKLSAFMSEWETAVENLEKFQSS